MNYEQADLQEKLRRALSIKPLKFTTKDGRETIVPSRSCGRFLTLRQIAQIEGVPLEQVVVRFAREALVPVRMYVKDRGEHDPL